MVGRLGLRRRLIGVAGHRAESTGLVYGHKGGRWVGENDSCAPIDSYPLSKLSAERFLLAMEGLDVRVLRLPVDDSLPRDHVGGLVVLERGVLIDPTDASS